MNVKEVVESSGKSIDELANEIGGIRRVHLLDALNGVVHPVILGNISDRLIELGYAVSKSDESEPITEPDATPVAAQMMEEHDVDPACVSSSSGRITVMDVRRYIKNKE